MSITHDKVYRDSYRVADDSLNRYELYVGEDALPDFDSSDQPVATSATLPFSYTPDPADSALTKVLNIVVRKRNQFNLLSHNQYPTLIEIDDMGDEELGPLSAPEILRVTDETNGEIVVTARYPRDVDQNEADTWEIYVELGVDPDPDLDTPVATVTMGLPGVEYSLRQVIDELTPGSTYHVMVVVSRSEESGDGVVGESAVIQHTLAETYDIDAGEASMFSGN